MQPAIGRNKLRRADRRPMRPDVEATYRDLQRRLSVFLSLLDGEKVPRFVAGGALTLIQRMDLWRRMHP